MIPYLEIHAFHLGPLWVRPHHLLVGVGILTAHFLLLGRVRRAGLSVPLAAAMSLSAVLAGWLGALLFRNVYFPELLRQDWRNLLGLARGAASFGGIAAGLLGACLLLAVRRVKATERWRYLDALAFVFPVGWVFGRIGCSLVHDHPGIRSTSWLAVRYPDAPRYDLATLEVLFVALLLIPLFLVLDRRARPPRFFLGLLLLLYGVFRVWLDGLHVDPPRYLGVSVDRLFYAPLALMGAWVLWKAKSAWKQA